MSKHFPKLSSSLYKLFRLVPRVLNFFPRVLKLFLTYMCSFLGTIGCLGFILDYLAFFINCMGSFICWLPVFFQKHVGDLLKLPRLFHKYFEALKNSA